MALQKGSKLYNTFVGGLNTDASPLTYPANASLDESNMRLLTDGSRRRRLGIDYEDSYVLEDLTLDLDTLSTQVICSYTWFSVGNDATTNFQVIQVFNNLYFYDCSEFPISNGKKSFTVDLDDYLAPNKVSSGTEYIDATTGRGALFVSNANINPIYITYDADSDAITVTQLDLKVRDVTGLDDTLAIDDNPTTLSDEHKYNLLNQGWTTTYISSYDSDQSAYPSNAQQWDVGKTTDGSGNPTVSIDLIVQTNFGNTPAAKGHFILDAFSKDRATASGITGLDTEVIIDRPTSLCGFSGRIWWCTGSTIYFSQVLLEDLSNAGYCYQSADPTAEDVNALVDSDGGTLTITEAINIKCLRPVGNSLVAWADNGVWIVAGNTQSGFKATEYQVSNVSAVDCVSKTTVVRAEGIYAWWASTGIYVLSLDETVGTPKIQSISDNKIKTYFDSLDPAKRLNAKGTYDIINKTIIWGYKGTDNTTAPLDSYDAMLLLDLRLNSFYKYSITVRPLTPFIAGFTLLPTINSKGFDETIVVGADTVVIGSDDVVITLKTIDFSKSLIKFLTIVPDGTGFDLTFSDFKDESFLDWYTNDSTGTDAPAYCVTGYLIEGDAAHFKQAPYILSFLSRTETGFTGDDTTGYSFVNPSGGTMQARWDWADSASSNKWGPEQKIYRFKQLHPVPADLSFDNGFPVVVSKNKVRGRGRSLHLKFASEPAKDIVLLGWHIEFNIMSEV